MAAHRTQAGPFTAQVATQQQQIDDHVDRGDGMLVLGDAHAPAGDHALGVQIDIARLAKLRLAQA